jgi:hypothetical protein
MHYEITDRTTGRVVNRGDQVIDFRGEAATLLGADRANEPGRDGKVSVRYKLDGWEASYYAGVFDLTVAEVQR